MVYLAWSAILLLVISTSATPVPAATPTVFSKTSGNAALFVSTPLGTARGVAGVSGTRRFSVKYASAKRWSSSAVATKWELPNGSNNPAAMPLPCPQPDASSSSFAEDCLSMVLYVPNTLSPMSEVPTMLWIHGGSFIVGGSTNPGLDGSKLAIATGSIIAVVQYRLGALGFMAPHGKTNLAVEDIVTALNFLKKVVPSFGGNSAQITIAGQSAGATMVRAMLAVPSADSLFRSAIIESDAMDYGFLSTTTQQKFQAHFNSQIGCSASASNCQQALSLDSILSAQMDLFSTASSLDPSAGQGQPIRPVRDNTLIFNPLDLTAAFGRVTKPLLVTTVLNEAGPAIFGTFDGPLPPSAFNIIVNATFGPERTASITQTPFYNPASLGTSGDARVLLEKLGTDYLWKCSSWSFARQWVKSGGTAFVGMYVAGATYPGNEQVSFCTENGHVCHQDDIEIVFGTVPNPTPAQAALVAEMQVRYRSFLGNGTPNLADGGRLLSLTTWPSATTTDVRAINLGGTGRAPIGACDPSVWGQDLLYDYQVFGI